MKSVTKTLHTPPPASTKSCAYPDPRSFCPKKDNHVKNPGVSSGYFPQLQPLSSTLNWHTPSESAGWV